MTDQIPRNPAIFPPQPSEMFSLPSFKLPSFLAADGKAYPSIDIAPVETYDVETAAEKRPRTLKHLLKANHANHSIIYHDLRFHNHAPHVSVIEGDFDSSLSLHLRFWAQHTSWAERTNI
jgi:hypothetical protein